MSPSDPAATAPSRQTNDAATPGASDDPESGAARTDANPGSASIKVGASEVAAASPVFVTVTRTSNAPSRRTLPGTAATAVRRTGAGVTVTVQGNATTTTDR